MKRIAIFGGSGFIGTNLINELGNLDCQINNYDIVEYYTEIQNYSYKFMDIKDDKNDYSFLQNFDYVYLLSALLGKRCNNEPINGWETNVKGLTNILFCLSQLKSKPTIIFSSSAMVYDNQIKEVPLSEKAITNSEALYEQSKIIIESLIRSACFVFGLKAIIFRFFTVYGQGPASKTKGHFIPTWISQAKEHNKISIYGDGRQTIDLTHVTDVTKALIAALNYNLTHGKHETFNIASGIETKVKNIANWFKKIKPDLELSYVSTNQRYPLRRCADIRKAERLLGYKLSILPENGIRSLIENEL